MRNLALVVIVVLALGGIGYYFLQQSETNFTQRNPSVTNGQENTDAPETQVVAQNLDTPWELVFLPDGGMLVTERPGRVRYISDEGELRENPIAQLDQVREVGEGGLLGMALHPDFETNSYVYLYYTYSGQGNNTLNRVVRMRYSNQTLSDEEIILNAIPGASNHNGGRIAFGPDDLLYITTGDAQEPSLAQDRNSLAGKILRITPDGDPAPGNPFDNEVYSYGHRNAQGLAWDRDQRLWSTEHGRSGVQSGLDELNLIEEGENYGWPTIQGDETRSTMRAPVRHSGATTTWAPAGAAIIDNTLYFVGLRGSALYATSIQNGTLGEVISYYDGVYGRLRIAQAGSDGMLYIATSNQDGRGRPQQSDDKIIRINPTKL